MPPPAPRTFYVITMRGDVGPYTRDELREQLAAGAVRSEDQVRNAFGRPLGVVADALSDASSGRTPAKAGPPVADPPMQPAAPRRSPVALLIGLAAAGLIAAVILVSVFSRTAPTATATPVPLPTIPDLPADTGPTVAKPPVKPPQADALPDGWTYLDLGGSQAKGRASCADGIWTVEGSGWDVWGPQDECGFVHREVTGDFSLVVRVMPGKNADKIGLMVRSSLAPSAAMAFVLLTRDDCLRFTHRKTNQSNVFGAGSTTARLPVWLQLTRRGKVIGGYWSSDGKTWTGVANKQEIAAMPATVRLGMAICGRNRSLTNRATLTDFSLKTP